MSSLAATQTLRDKTAITGIGYTEITRKAEKSLMALTVEACLGAVKDAGLTIQDIDGVLEFQWGDSVLADSVANTLGTSQLNFALDWHAGGNGCTGLVAVAASLVHSGLCRNVLVYRSLKRRSGTRRGSAEAAMKPAERAGGDQQFALPYGLYGAPIQFAMKARTHMAKFGTTQHQLGAIAVNNRQNASRNPRAQMRKPITIDDYDNSRLLIDPFRILDCCQESDGACALVVSSAEQARTLHHTPVYIMAGMGAPGPTMRTGESWESPAKYTAPVLLQGAGISLRDIDLFEVYDCFTYSALVQIEDFGWCAKGEGGPFVEQGNVGLDSAIPIDTGGGLLSEGYIHGLNNICQAVQQLRHCAEDGCPEWSKGKHTFDRSICRQVRDAEIALATGMLGHGGIILRR